jgi:hypothetical protein
MQSNFPVIALACVKIEKVLHAYATVFRELYNIYL